MDQYRRSVAVFNAIQTRMQDYDRLLSNVRRFASAKAEESDLQWRAFAAGVNAARRFPEVRTLAFVNRAGTAARDLKSGASALLPPEWSASAASEARAMTSRSGPGLAVITPIYPAGSKELNGWTVLSFNPDALIRSLFPNSNVDITFADARTGVLLGDDKATRTIRDRASLGVQSKREMTFAGQRWRVYQRQNNLLREIVRRPSLLASALFFGLALMAMVFPLVRYRPIDFSAEIHNDLTDVVEVVDSSGKIVFASASLEKALGWRPDADGVLGRQFIDFVHPGDVDAVRTTLEQAGQSNAQRHLWSARLSSGDGSWRHVEGTVRALRAQRFSGLLIAMHDVTATVMLERQVEQAVRVESLGRVAAQVAHEFNNVLMGVGVNAEVLAKLCADDERQLSICRTLTKAVGRGKNVAEEILRFSRPTELHKRVIDVREWIRELERELQPVLEGSALDVHLPEEEVTVVGDPDQLAQVLTNVVLNARDAMDRHGRIECDVDKTTGGQFRYGIVPGGEFVHLRIRDHGKGIPPDQIDHIFEPLYTTKKGGNGLGLAVSYQIVAKHNGLMFAESTPSEGTSVHVFLPISSQRAAAAQ